MHSIPEFFLIALAVTLTPGPATATILRIAARDTAAARLLADLVWFAGLAWAVDRARGILRPTVQRIMERTTGAVLVGLGARLAAEVR